MGQGARVGAAKTKRRGGNPGSSAGTQLRLNLHRVEADRQRRANKDSAALAKATAGAGAGRTDGEESGRHWTPHGYQIRAAKHLLSNAGGALFLDPGLGKTSICLAAIKALKDAGKLEKALVVAPLRVAELVWPNEAQKWTDFHGLKVVLLHGTHKDKLLHEPADIHVINPEGLEWLFSTTKFQWCTLIVDESTKFKNWSAQRTKLLRAFLPEFDRRWILTGTPAPNGIGDLFSQIYICDLGRRFGQYITHFRRNYMMQQVDVINGNKVFSYTAVPGALKKIESKIKDIVLRLEAKDWLELPELIHNRIEVQLPPHARAVYTELEREFIVALKSGTITAMNAGVLGMKLRQFTNGFAYDEDRRVHLIHETKIDALEDLVEELGKPLLVAVAFLPEVIAIRKRLGKNIPYLGGGVTKTEAKKVVDGWNAGRLPIVLAHPSSVAHGLNLQGGQHVCWFGLTWNLEEYNQFIQRVWRQGQMHRVVCHSIVARNTMDIKVERALREKGNLLEELLKYLK